MENILVTGGLGYIGSHTVLKLLESGYFVIILDNLSNSKITVYETLKKISNSEKIKLYIGDTNDNLILDKIFSENKITSVVHFAALKSVSESINQPLEYYYNNINGTLCLIKNMDKHDVKNIIFSSSCTVYGEPDNYPVTEGTKLKTPKTPYGKTKSICETILEDSNINCISLRYFNPIGNHKTGILYEDPNGVPENLIPFIIGVITKKYEYLKVFGDNYNTPDGTAIRDYIDVNDLADAHVKALKIINNKKYDVFNIGTGNGYSVLEIINEFKNKGFDLPYRVTYRRDGDIEKIWSDISKAKNILKWEPKINLSESIDSIVNMINYNIHN